MIGVMKDAFRGRKALGKINRYGGGYYSRRTAGPDRRQTDLVVDVLDAIQSVISAVTDGRGGKYIASLSDKTAGGATDLKGRRIAITAAPLKDNTLKVHQQAEIMLGLAAHEIGHAKYSAQTEAILNRRWPGDPTAKVVANVLDDHRLERRMAEDFPGFAPLFRPVLKYLARPFREKVWRWQECSITERANFAIASVRYAAHCRWSADEATRNERQAWREWADTFTEDDSATLSERGIEAGLNRLHNPEFPKDEPEPEQPVDEPEPEVEEPEDDESDEDDESEGQGNEPGFDPDEFEDDEDEGEDENDEFNPVPPKVDDPEEEGESNDGEGDLDDALDSLPGGTNRDESDESGEDDESEPDEEDSEQGGGAGEFGDDGEDADEAPDYSAPGDPDAEHDPDADESTPTEVEGDDSVEPDEGESEVDSDDFGGNPFEDGGDDEGEGNEPDDFDGSEFDGTDKGNADAGEGQDTDSGVSADGGTDADQHGGEISDTADTGWEPPEQVDEDDVIDGVDDYLDDHKDDIDDQLLDAAVTEERSKERVNRGDGFGTMVIKIEY